MIRYLRHRKVSSFYSFRTDVLSLNYIQLDYGWIYPMRGAIKSTWNSVSLFSNRIIGLRLTAWRFSTWKRFALKTLGKQDQFNYRQSVRYEKKKMKNQRKHHLYCWSKWSLETFLEHNVWTNDSRLTRHSPKMWSDISSIESILSLDSNNCVCYHMLIIF